MGLGWCLERLGFGTDTSLSLGGAGSAGCQWSGRRAGLGGVFPGSLNTDCLRSSDQLWRFVLPRSPILAQGDILLHCGEPQPGAGMGLRCP